MGNIGSTMIIVPDKDVMVKILDRLVELEEMIKKGTTLTRVQKLERKELLKVAKVMRNVQKSNFF